MKPILLIAAAVLLLNFSGGATVLRPEKDKIEKSTTSSKNKKHRKRRKDNVADEETVLQEALKKLFNPTNYSVSGLSLTEDGGEKILSGSVSFFNNEGVTIECTLSADSKIKSISTTFPASATFRINHLDKLSQGEFRSLLPNSLSKAGISIKTFVIHFDETGKNLESFETTLAASNWDFLDFKEFKMNALTLKLELFKSQSRIGGELAGEVMIGSLKTQLTATMMPDKPMVFVGTIPGGQGKLNVKEALYSVAGRDETEKFFGLMPGDIFNTLTMPELALTAIPGDKKISLVSTTDAGSMDLAVQKKGAKKDIKLILQANDLGKILQTDILKDANLSNPLVLISSVKDRGVSIPGAKDNATVDLEEGINVVTSIELSKDIKDFLKLERINLSGSIDKSKRIKLSAKQEMDLPIGDSGIKFTGVSFGLEANPTPELSLDGTLSIPIKDHPPLRFSAGLSTSPLNLAFGGQLELLTDGDDRVWRNPFGIPGLGIKDLHGALSMMPTPPFFNKLELDGEILLGKNLSPEGNPIQGSLHTKLDVMYPFNSSFEASVKNLTVTGMINAFSDTQLTGEVANLLRNGIKNATISIKPSDHEVSASGEFELLGKSAQIAMAVSPTKFTASGSMDPWEIKSGNFTVFSVSGAGGNARPGFLLEVSADPKFSLNGAVTALESMKGSANIVIGKNGFVVDLTGDIFSGVFQGELHAYGRNLSTNPVIHAELDLSQRIVNDFKVSLKTFIVKQAGDHEKDILAVRNKVNTGAGFLDDTFKGSLNAVNDLQNLSATAGVFLVDNLIPDVTRISFVGDLNTVSTKIDVRVDYRAAGNQMPPITISMDLKNPDYNGELEKMAEQMGKEVLKAFESVGEQVANLGEGGKELLTDLGSGVIVAGKEVGKVANDVIGEIDKFWNGANFEPVKTGPELTELSPDMRHYSVSIKKVVAIKAEDDPLQGKMTEGAGKVIDGLGSLVTGNNSNAAQKAMTITDPKIEVYGAILVVSDRSMRISDPNTTNSYAWSRNRVNAETNIGVGGGFSVDQRPKHYYAKNGTNHSITIKSRLKEYDEGEHYGSDGEFSGQYTISNLGSWDWINGQRLDDSFTATTNDGGKQSILKIDFSIVLEPKISIQQIRSAVASRNIESVRRLLRKGGDITEGSVLAPAVQNKDIAMINFLLASGAKLEREDIATALQPQSFSPDIATKLIIRSTTASTADDLNKAIALGNKNIVNLMLSRGATPTAQQLQTALSQNKLDVADALLANKAPATPADLNQAVAAMNIPTASLLIKYGVQPSVAMLNQALQANNKAMTQLILQNQNPDQTSYQIAADKNDLALFTMVSSKGVLLESDAPSQKAIDLNNIELLKQTLISGASPSNALSYAVQKQNAAAINLCLDYDGNPNLATGYAASKNDAALFTKLIDTYKANGTMALSAAVAANNINLARIALERGAANPDYDLKAQADQGNEAMVKLLVEFNGNPDLAMPGTIANQKVALLEFLVQSGANLANPGYITQAAELQSLDMVKILVDNGANPDPGMPLAVNNNNYAMTSYLLSAGANVNGFMKAPAAAGNLQMVKILLDNGASPDEGMASAVQASQLEIAKILLSYGASSQGHLAQPAQTGNVEMIKLLLEYGANPNEGITQAVGANQTEAAVLLLEAGASVRGLMAPAAGLGNKTIVELLLARGVNPTEGITPAVQNNFTEVAILLLENDAAIDGLIPLAAGNGNETIVAKLLGMGAVADEGTKPAVTNKHTGVARQLIAAGANVESSSFMVIAVANRQEEMVRLLQQNKCDVTYTDAKGNTFLHLVSGDDGEVGLVKAFIEFGLDVDKKNIEGNTSLHLAAESGKDNLEVVQIIVEAGADVNAVNNKGETPRKAAKGRKIKKYLKDNGGERKIKK